jgi:hypothetical protein
MTSTRKARMEAGGAVAHTNDWNRLLKHYNFTCLCCKSVFGRERMTKDHIIPAGMPGASNGIQNMQPMCRPCNVAKDRHVIDYRPDMSCLLPWADKINPRGSIARRKSLSSAVQQISQPVAVKPAGCPHCHEKDLHIAAQKEKLQRLGQQLCETTERISHYKKENHRLRMQQNLSWRNVYWIVRKRIKKLYLDIRWGDYK